MVTFDVYGTLIDWETGVFDAFQKEATRDGFTIEDPQEVISRFHEYEREIEGGSYELYAEVLRRCAVRDRQGHRLAARALARRLPARLRRALGAVQGDQPAADEVLQEVPDGADLEHRRQAPGPDAPPHPHDFDLVVTAQQVRSYKPDPAHFKECARRIGTKKGWVHIAASYYHDVEPCLKAKVPVDLGQPQEGGARRRPEEADGRGQDLLEAAKLLGAA